MLAKAIIVACVLSSLLVIPQRTGAEPQIILTPQEYISLYAQKYGAVESQLLKVATCESKLKPNAINYHDGGKGKHSFGILQFQESTFLAWEKKFGEDLDYYSYHDQIKLGAYMFSKGQQKQWTCY